MDAKGHRPPNRLQKKLAAGEVCLGVTVTMNSPVITELLSRLDLDWIWIETEHTSTSEESVLGMLQATNGGEVSAVVRVPWNDKTMIKRILDTGPDGVIVPLVNSKAEAEAAVRAMKYPPWGERGAGLSRAQCYGLTAGEYMEHANEDVTTILMIEHVEAVKNINDILSVKGVDSVMVGALDLSGSMGKLGQTADPEVEGAVQTVLKACKANGMPCGIITVAADQANQRIEQGFTNIIIGIDVLYLLMGVNGALEQIKR